MSLILLLNPKQYGGASTDTSDILDRYAKRRRQDKDLEEEYALRILKARQEKIVLPKAIDKKRLAATLRQKLENYPLTNADKQKRLKLMLILLALEDYD